ncbi:MAG: carbon-nitrogen hydrolase family protein [Planctomycetota bacterium]
MADSTLTVAIAQIAPVLLDRARTIDKAAGAVVEAAATGARVVCFGEGFAPGYPVWLDRTDAARFDAPDQKAMHAIYLDQGVDCEADHLDPVRDAARDGNTWVVLGIMEKPRDRGGHTLFASAVVIDDQGAIRSVHRKLMPTYEERLSWSPGDAHGLVTHPGVGPFTLGALNCWENWMPLARTALYAQGEDLHVAIWPGSERITKDITRYVAREGRSYVLSASAIIRPEDVPAGLPLRERMVEGLTGPFQNGGSCIAGPDGEWIVEPVVGEERIITATIDHTRVLEERQNFDATGHYSRPELLRLTVDRQRQTAADFID